MKKYIIPILAFIIVFATTKHLLSIRKVKPTELIVSLEAKVLEDDSFQVFYMHKDMKGFSQDKSVRTEVFGCEDVQEITFSLPINIPIRKLRMDVGGNKNQPSIEVQHFELRALRASKSFDISEFFKPNKHLKIEKNTLIAKVINDNYDPFLVSKLDTLGTFMELREIQTYFPASVIYSLALIFALSIAITIRYYNVFPKQFAGVGYILGFVLIMLAPSIASFFNIGPSVTLREQRTLAPKPELELSEDFPKQYEDYYNDNYRLRSVFISVANESKINLFNSSSNPERALFGKNGFLFYNSAFGDIYASYSRTNIFSEEELEQAYQKMKATKETLNRKEIKYVFGFWPNKHSIYPEFLPLEMSQQITSDVSLADQATSYFKKRNLSMFDVREALLEGKKERILYQKLDTHWNFDGAFLAYQTFCDQTFPVLGLTPFKRDDFIVRYQRSNYGDLVGLLGVNSIKNKYTRRSFYELKNKNLGYTETCDVPGHYPERTVITLNPNCGNEKVAVVFRDSYTVALVQFMSLHYSKVIYIREGTVNMDLVNEIQPDVVISAPVERYLDVLLK